MAKTKYLRLQADRQRFYHYHEAFGQGRQGGTRKQFNVLHMK